MPAPVHLSPRVRAFLLAPHAVTIGTTGPDGEPHQAVAWYRLDPDDRILLNSRWPRRWPTDLSLDGRASLAILDGANAIRWVGLAAVVETRIDDLEAARDDICALAVRYGDDGPDTIARFRSQPRVSFRMRITGVHDHLGDG
ncbi:MAG TPA: pyridoxamine 5'-phosphate oxidase family protein [Candidatus Sulfomarinibacteraceae bacterium]|nr:pyridoxamine 5'-phosphate oxidase family protein [Candidatus Sulfomarinibacteraceae bacterium]